MKFAAASLALVAAVSVQAIGPVDPSKLANGWCITVTEDSCVDTVAPIACGANATIASHCEAVFSSDMVCMSFKTSCTCQPKAGGEVKDISFEAFNETFSSMCLLSLFFCLVCLSECIHFFFRSILIPTLCLSFCNLFSNGLRHVR